MLPFILIQNFQWAVTAPKTQSEVHIKLKAWCCAAGFDGSGSAISFCKVEIMYKEISSHINR